MGYYIISHVEYKIAEKIKTQIVEKFIKDGSNIG
jgi:hypothetical protein